MALPTYDKSKRRKSFEQLPKGAYVIVIKNAKEEMNKSGNGSHLTIAFDIAEGEYKGFYQNQFENSTGEDRVWPYDARHYVGIPDDNSQQFVWDNWNTFFADLEDSNSGFVFGGDIATLKGKLIGGKFCIEQNQAPNGTIYDHTRLKWTCVADDVRQGKAGKLPNDKLVGGQTNKRNNVATDADGWMNVPEGTDEEVPW